MSELQASANRRSKKAMLADPDNWRIPFFDFVDDFRYCRNVRTMMPRRIKLDNPRFDAMLASTVEYLCDELHLKTPEWIVDVPCLKEPWFVSGIENLKAMAIVESPVYFRRRLIFVLENFLERV